MLQLVGRFAVLVQEHVEQFGLRRIHFLLVQPVFLGISFFNGLLGLDDHIVNHRVVEFLVDDLVHQFFLVGQGKRGSPADDGLQLLLCQCNLRFTFLLAHLAS